MSGHRDFFPSIPDRLTKAVMTAAGFLPGPLLRLVGGTPRRMDGQVLDPHFQAGLRVISMTSEGEYEDLTVEKARSAVERSAFTVSGKKIDLAVVTDIVLPARRHRPGPGRPARAPVLAGPR